MILIKVSVIFFHHKNIFAEIRVNFIRMKDKVSAHIMGAQYLRSIFLYCIIKVIFLLLLMTGCNH